MIERFIAPALTFIVLVGGHVAVATALFVGPAPQTDAGTLTAKSQPVAAQRAS